MKKLREIWQSASWLLRSAALAFAVIAVGYAIFSVGNAVHARRYAKQLQATEARATAAETKAAALVEQADDANAKAAMLEIELKKVSQVVLDLNAELAQAQTRTQTVRNIYVHAKETPSPAIPLTGDALADSRALCEQLRTAGFPCEARR